MGVSKNLMLWSLSPVDLLTGTLAPQEEFHGDGIIINKELQSSTIFHILIHENSYLKEFLLSFLLSSFLPLHLNGVNEAVRTFGQ